LKKILIVTHWFYPHQVPRAFRSYELYLQLIREGYDVDVIVSKDKIFLSNHNQSKLQKNTIKSNKHNKFKLSKLYELTRKIFLYFIGELYFISRRKFVVNELSKININDYESVIVITLPFYTAYYVSKTFKNIRKLNKFRGKFILDIGDPFYGYQTKRAFYFKYIQKKVFDFFDYITIPIEDAVPYYREYVEEEKIRILPQAFDLSHIDLYEYKKNVNPTFAFAGSFYEDIRNPEKLFEYLIDLNDDFTFIIYCNLNSIETEKIINPMKDKLDKRFVFKDYIPREKLIKELSKMDFLINLENLSGTQSPSKLIDYGLTKRPIISINPSEDLFINLRKFIITKNFLKLIGGDNVKNDR
jgi:hypothetical protein